jgi:hypothetical protein
MTQDLRGKNARLRDKIERLVENHPELETIVSDIALKQPANASPEECKPICNSGAGDNRGQTRARKLFRGVSAVAPSASAFR